MKSDRETCCKNTSNDLKDCQKTRSYPEHVPKQVWDYSKLDNSSMLFRHQEEKEINHCAENIRCLEIKKELAKKLGSVRFGPVLGIEVCNHNGGYSVEVQVQSSFQDQTVSWIRIMKGIDKFVREAMPIQEKEKASGKRAAKARPILKSSWTSVWDFTLTEQNHWIDIEKTSSWQCCKIASVTESPLTDQICSQAARRRCAT